MTLFTVHQKETANEAWLDSSQAYMMEVISKTVKLLALNYFLKKVLSQISGIVLNTSLSYYDSICCYSTDNNSALPSSESSKVLNG